MNMILLLVERKDDYINDINIGVYLKNIKVNSREIV